MKEIPSLEMEIISSPQDKLADRDQFVVMTDGISSDIDHRLGIIMGEISEPGGKSVAGWFLTGEMQIGGFVLFDNHKGVLILVNKFKDEDKTFLEDNLGKWGEIYTCSLDKNMGLPTKLPESGDFSFGKVKQAVLGNQMLGGIVGNLK